MAHEFTSIAADENTPTFIAADYLLGVVQRIVASRENSRVIIQGFGEIAILPGRQEYYTNAQNLTELCSVPSPQVEVQRMGEATPSNSSGSVRNINELLWTAAFYASQGRLIEGRSKYDVVQFRNWPNLTRLPVTSNAARICALLTRHPTTIMLLHRVLGIDKEEVYQIYSAAYCAGIANTSKRALESAISEAEAVSAQPEPAQERSLFRSLFSKISGL